MLWWGKKKAGMPSNISGRRPHCAGRGRRCRYLPHRGRRPDGHKLAGVLHLGKPGTQVPLGALARRALGGSAWHIPHGGSFASLLPFAVAASGYNNVAQIQVFRLAGWKFDHLAFRIDFEIARERSFHHAVDAVDKMA